MQAARGLVLIPQLYPPSRSHGWAEAASRACSGLGLESEVPSPDGDLGVNLKPELDPSTHDHG